MDTSIEDNEQTDKPEDGESCCDSACSCHAQGLSNKVKLAICLVVAVAAVAVVLMNSASRARTATATTPFATAAVANAQAPASATGTPTSPTATKQAAAAIWGPTLNSFESLNQVATDKDAVFVFVPAKDEKQTATIRTQIESAAEKAQAKGQSVAAFMLSKEAKEYPLIAKKSPPPCVLAMAKGAGAVPVSGEITETKLLEALVAASRPSSCGPGGCGPGGCK